MLHGGIIKEGEKVYCNNFPITLVKIIGHGEEGIIYKTDTPYVCKIYKEDSLDNIKYLKLTYMLRMNIKQQGICWPLALVFNTNGLFCGYLMINAYGKELKDAIFNNKNSIMQQKKWTRRDLVELSLTILRKINYLHKKGVILGDINTENILVNSPTEVFFVDTDSYQINGIPCPVGTDIFTAPEIKEGVYSNFLRSLGNEYFAVSTLIFMILMEGNTPYEGKKSQEIVRNVRLMNFTLPLNVSNEYLRGNGDRINKWNNIPYFIREAFYNTFKKYGKRSSEYARYTTEEWVVLMERYLKELSTGSIKDDNGMTEIVQKLNKIKR